MCKCVLQYGTSGYLVLFVMFAEWHPTSKASIAKKLLPSVIRLEIV